MKVVVIDGQGGGMGKTIVTHLKEKLPECRIISVGTNVIATSTMLKAGANAGATGENAVAFNCSNADVVVGPMGIMLPNAMLGEITPKMASAVVNCDCPKVLIPVSKCHINIVGVEEKPLNKYIEQAISYIKEIEQK